MLSKYAVAKTAGVPSDRPALPVQMYLCICSELESYGKTGNGQ